MWSLEGPAISTMLADAAPVDADAQTAAAEVNFERKQIFYDV